MAQADLFKRPTSVALASQKRPPRSSDDRFGVSGGMMDNIMDAVESDFAAVPAALFGVQEVILPISPASELTIFGESTNFFSNGVNGVQAADGYVTSMLSTTSVPFPYYLRGVGNVVTCDVMGWSITGAIAKTPTTATAVPAFDGVVPAGGFPADAISRPAQLTYGSPTWLAAQAFLMSRQVSFILNNRYTILLELAADIGAVEANVNALGFGLSNVDVLKYIRQVNDRLDAIGVGYDFIPPNNDGAPTPTPVPPPTAPAAYGSISLPGVYKKPGRFEMEGVVVVPGQPIQIQFTRLANETQYQARLLEQTGIQDEVTVAANYTNGIAGVPGFSSVVPVNGGFMRFGSLLYGWQLTDAAVMDYLVKMGSQFPADFYRSTGAHEFLRSCANSCGVAMPMPKRSAIGNKRALLVADSMDDLIRDLSADLDAVSAKEVADSVQKNPGYFRSKYGYEGPAGARG